MRIKLKEGKQEELILLAKENKSWRELANTLNVNDHYLLHELRNEKRLISNDSYKILCKLAKVNFDQYILKKLSDNWGKAKGGRISLGSTKEVIEPSESIELAELYGAMLGDGNVTSIKGYKVGTYQIRITGDSRHDATYFNFYLKPLIEKLFNIKVRISTLKNRNVINLVAGGKKLVAFFKNKGFKPGDKIRNKLPIPNWIKNNKEFLKACIRGLYDTDGSIYKLTNQNSHQICFTNYNKTLLNNVRDSLISIGINPSKITKEVDIVITKKSELRSFLKHIGFRNSRHLNKVKMWNLAP